MKTSLYAIAFFVLSSVSHAASFDCGKATSLVEKAICSEMQLSELDDLLTQSYKQALANLTDSDALRSEQKAWLKNVRNKCQDSACLKRAYNDRLTTLKDIRVSSVPSLGGVTGVYKTKDADLNVQQVSDVRIKFQISSVNFGPGGQINDCSASGEAPLKGGTAVYVDRENDCGLIFKFSPGKTSVTQDGSCGSDHASVSGNYKIIKGKPPAFDN